MKRFDFPEIKLLPDTRNEKPDSYPVKVLHVNPDVVTSTERKSSAVRTYNICESTRPSGSNALLPAVVYYVTDGTFVKVGYTTNLAKRLATLQTGNARKLEVLKVIQFSTALEAYKCEQRIHKSLTRYNVRGEWFDIQ
jgi:hypothetical protein